MNRKSIWKTLAWAALVLCLVLVGIVASCNILVVTNARGKAFSDISRIPNNNGSGLLLGTTPYTRIGHKESMFFKYRIEAALELYNANKVSRFLISGDGNSLYGIDEPQCMKDTLVAHGIPADRILLDREGFDTFESVYRANKVFGEKTFVIISQRYHNERALYLAEHLGLDTANVTAYNAETPKLSPWMLWIYFREALARVKMVADILSKE